MVTAQRMLVVHPVQDDGVTATVVRFDIVLVHDFPHLFLRCSLSLVFISHLLYYPHRDQLSNHHLTELCKLTFHKRDPTRVTIYYRGEHGDDVGNKEVFNVKRNKDFIEALQSNLKTLQG